MNLVRKAFLHPHGARKRSGPRYARFWLETLETRYTPSSPTSDAVIPDPNLTNPPAEETALTTVLVVEQPTDSVPAATGSQGSHGGASELSLTSSGDNGSFTLDSTPPVIQGFSCREEDPHEFTFFGQVIDADPGGLVVHFGGLTSLEGKTTITLSNGYFSFTLLLQEGESGQASAQVTNHEGLTSAIVYCVVDQTPIGGGA
jgi:hypothetical protein